MTSWKPPSFASPSTCRRNHPTQLLYGCRLMPVSLELTRGCGVINLRLYPRSCRIWLWVWLLDRSSTILLRIPVDFFRRLWFKEVVLTLGWCHVFWYFIQCFPGFRWNQSDVWTKADYCTTPTHQELINSKNINLRHYIVRLQMHWLRF